MNMLEKICGYFCLEEENKTLSAMRLTLLVFFADYLSALKDGKTLTSCSWKYNRVLAVEPESILSDLKYCNLFNLVEEKNNFIKKTKITYVSNESINIDNDILHTLNYLREKTKNMNYDDLLHMVFSLNIFNENEIYSILNLKEYGKKFISEQRGV